jgi:hypothetical protein
MGRTILVLVGVVFLTCAVGVRAHHSYADFLNETASIEGRLEKVEWANPHTILTVRTKDSTAYTAIWSPAAQLNRVGVKPTALRTGDVLVVSGKPHRDPAVHQLATLTGVRRLSDDWRWGYEGCQLVVTVNGENTRPPYRRC